MHCPAASGTRSTHSPKRRLSGSFPPVSVGFCSTLTCSRVSCSKSFCNTPHCIPCIFLSSTWLKPCVSRMLGTPLRDSERRCPTKKRALQVVRSWPVPHFFAAGSDFVGLGFSRVIQRFRLCHARHLAAHACGDSRCRGREGFRVAGLARAPWTPSWLVMISVWMRSAA